MSSTITEMHTGDLGEAIALWQATEHIGLDPDVDSPEALAAFLHRNAGLSFVARADGKLVGAVLCGTDGRRGYLNHLAVAPPYRKRGIGRQLVETVMGALKGMGIARCTTFVYAKNVPGQAFWASLGWQHWQDREVSALCCDTGWEQG
jgi:putative acetyltransferase